MKAEMDKELLYNKYFELTEEALRIFEYPNRKSVLVADIDMLESYVTGFNDKLAEYLTLRSSLSEGLSFVTDKTFRDKITEMRTALLFIGNLSKKIKNNIDYLKNTFGEISKEWLSEYEQKMYKLVYNTTINAVCSIGDYIGSYIDFLDGYKPTSVVAEDNKNALLAEEEQKKRDLREKAQSEFLKQIRIKRKK